MALGDLDGDGKIDIAGTDPHAGSPYVFRNTSNVGTINSSSLQSNVTFTPPSNGPQSVVIADLNLDGKPELIYACNTASFIGIFQNLTPTKLFSVAAAVRFLSIPL